MDGHPDDGDADRAAERAQWERARLVREQHDAEARQRLDERTAATAAAGAAPERSSRRLGLVAVGVAVVFLVAVGVMLVAIRRRSNEQPSWVAQLGLDTGSTAPGAAPQRLGTPASGATGSAATGDTTVTAGGPAVTGLDDDTPPVIDTTGDDFDHVYRQIETLEGWLLTHPEPERVADIYEPGTGPYTDLVSQLTQLQHDHETLHVENYRIVGVTMDQRPSADEVDLRYADTYTDAVTTADTGAVVSRAPYDGRARLWTLTLHRGDDGRWRVAASAFVQYGDVVPPG